MFVPENLFFIVTIVFFSCISDDNTCVSYISPPHYSYYVQIDMAVLRFSTPCYIEAPLHGGSPGVFWHWGPSLSSFRLQLGFSWSQAPSLWARACALAIPPPGRRSPPIVCVSVPVDVWRHRTLWRSSRVGGLLVRHYVSLPGQHRCIARVYPTRSITCSNTIPIIGWFLTAQAQPLSLTSFIRQICL